MLNRIGVALRRTREAHQPAGGAGSSGVQLLGAKLRDQIAAFHSAEGGEAPAADPTKDFASAASIEVLLCLLESMALQDPKLLPRALAAVDKLLPAPGSLADASGGTAAVLERTCGFLLGLVEEGLAGAVTGASAGVAAGTLLGLGLARGSLPHLLSLADALAANGAKGGDKAADKALLAPLTKWLGSLAAMDTALHLSPALANDKPVATLAFASRIEGGPLAACVDDKGFAYVQGGGGASFTVTRVGTGLHGTVPGKVYAEATVEGDAGEGGDANPSGRGGGLFLSDDGARLLVVHIGGAGCSELAAGRLSGCARLAGSLAHVAAEGLKDDKGDGTEGASSVFADGAAGAGSGAARGLRFVASKKQSKSDKDGRAVSLALESLLSPGPGEPLGRVASLKLRGGNLKNGWEAARERAAKAWAPAMAASVVLAVNCGGGALEDPFGDGVAFEADRHFLRPANKGTFPGGGDDDTLHGTGRVIHKDATSLK